MANAYGAALGPLETKIDTVDAVVDSILTDTGTTLPATLATIDGVADYVAELGIATVAFIAGDAAVVAND